MANVSAATSALAHGHAEAILMAAMPLPVHAQADPVSEALARWAPLATHGTVSYVHFLSPGPRRTSPPPTRRHLPAAGRGQTTY
jgi:hypothetical protein